MVRRQRLLHIAVPAVVRYAIPEANPSLYVGLSPGLTFPLNILLGISGYTQVAAWVCWAERWTSLACASPATAPAKEPVATQARTACCTTSEGKNSCSSRPFQGAQVAIE